MRQLWIVAGLTLCWGGIANAAEPCGGVRLDSGVVKTGKALPVKTDLAGDDLACAKAVAAAIKERAQIRSITLAAKVPSDRRPDGTAMAAAWTKVMVAAGIPEARISSIVPTSAPGTAAELSIAYREPTPRPVALVQAMTGKVFTGQDAAKLGPAANGTQLIQGDIVHTEKGAVARLALADGSFVSLLPDSMIKLGRIELTADLKRAVRLDLMKGRVEAIAEPKGSGSSFDIVTKTAIAGVRGTRFRVGELPSGSTGVETLDGKVELKSEVGEKQSVVIEAGKTAEVDHKGNATPPRPLLPGAQITAPLSGEVDRSVALIWQPVPGSQSYKIEVAADGELATQLRVYSSTSPGLAMPKDLPAGHWFWRVSAVDTGDVVGMPSKTYSFTVK